VNESLQAVIAFAREAFKAELLTPEGRVNAIVVFMAFVLVLAAGFIDVVQAFVRTWNSTYESGMPSPLWLVLEVGLLGLICVAIVGLLRR
jgi:hypothetical protein